MIYALTDSEMMAFSLLASSTVSPLSPLYDLCGDLDEIRGLAEKTAGLISMKLVCRDGDGYAITPQGDLLADALFEPDSVCEFERKNDFGNALTVLRKGNLWHVHSVCKERKLHLIWAPFSKELLVRFLQDCLLPGYEPDLSQRRENADFVLSYDEWFAFLASQFLFVRRGLSKIRPIGQTFTKDDLCGQEWIDYFSVLLTALNAKKYAGTVQYLFQDTNADILQVALQGLCDKHILTERDGIYSYTENTVTNLDNDLTVDTVGVKVFHKEETPYSSLITLRKNGVIIMRDNGSSVHITSADAFPFDLFLE